MQLQRQHCATIQQTLTAFSKYLSEKAVDSPHLSAEVILAFVLNITRLDIITRPERPITDPEWECLYDLILRRGKGEPVAYLVGMQEFFGRNFSVSPATLIPRPETEHLIEEVITRCKDWGPFTFADLGTGSGCIAITVCAELPQARGIAVDRSGAALAVARSNATTLGVANRLTFLHADFTTDLFHPQSLSLIATNPPYVSEREYQMLSREVREYEPHTALVPGTTGTEHAEQLIRNAQHWLQQNGILIMEMGYWQAKQHLSFLNTSPTAWKEKSIIKDLSGHDRLTLAVAQ